MRKRTYFDRVTQLGNIAWLECCIMRSRGQRGAMPRTNRARAILKVYEQNVFGRDLDICGADKYIAENEQHTNAEWQKCV